MNVVCAGGRHEKTLGRRHAVQRVQDHHVDMFRSGESRSRGAARVARGGAQDRHPLATQAEDVIIELRNQTHRHVLEGERGAVMQFEHPAAGADFGERGDGLVRERRVGAHAHLADRLFRQARSRESRQDARSRFHIGGGGVRTLDLREGVRAEQAAVGREAHQACRHEVDRFGVAASGDVLHFFDAPSRAGPKRRRPARA